MNHKGLLQEFCQKKHLDLPKYETSPTQNKWSSTVIVGKIRVTGGPFDSKKESEADAARLALEQLSKKKCSFDPNNKEWKIYMIDLENRPCFDLPDSQNLYIGFLGKNHHSVKKYRDWYVGFSVDLEKVVPELLMSRAFTNRILYTIDDRVRDTADHFMSAMISPIIKFLMNTPNESPQIVIVTGDHAGNCTKACFKVFLEEIATKIKVTVSNVVE